MTVVRARVYGYCMGVRRAMEMAVQEAKSDSPAGVYTMGPLIHNPSALTSLGALGVGVLDERKLPDRLDNATIVVRAHGVPPSVIDALVARGGRVVDATCPRVRLSQRRAASFFEAGYHVFLAGEREHGEVVAVAAYAKNCIVVGSREEAEEAASTLASKNPRVKAALIGQTTISAAEYAEIAAAILVVFPDLEVVDSICPATKERQSSLVELCESTEAVVVVGGKASANTRRLYSMAMDRGKPAWHVESPEDVPEALGRFSVVGLTAGASTPDEVISAVEARLRSLPRIEQNSTIS